MIDTRQIYLLHISVQRDHLQVIHIYQTYGEELLGCEWFVYKWDLIGRVSRLVLDWNVL